MARFFAKFFVEGATVLSKAFYSAYRLALQNARGGAAAATGKGARGGKMQLDEALQILNIEKSEMNRKTIEEQFRKYYDSNDPGNGGSFYLQSKIYRAREAADRELIQRIKKAKAAAAGEKTGSDAKSDK